MNYWDDKEKRAEQAKKHTEKMERDYKELIENSVSGTVVYSPDFEFSEHSREEAAEIEINDIDSVTAILKWQKAGEKMAVLNFSSYKNPGGGFIIGSKAQEECLCHESFLYNVLVRVKDFYEWNIKHKNKALYLNRGLYSPNVLFARDEASKAFCDVITCAAPNKSAAQKYQSVSDEENASVLESRIKFVLDVSRDNQVDVLVLGAYGCGVFGQDASEVAAIFKKLLSTTHRCFKKVIFAIPKGRDGNLEKFKKVFNR